MGKKHRRRRKITLGVEPLEDRIAPVILVNGQSYTFAEDDGDTIRVEFFGPGQAEILDPNDADPGVIPGSAFIDRIFLHNTRDTSRLVVSDIATGDGDDRFFAGKIFTVPSNRSRMGEIHLNGGTHATVVGTAGFLDAPHPYLIGPYEYTNITAGRLRVLRIDALNVEGCRFETTGTNVFNIDIDVPLGAVRPSDFADPTLILLKHSGQQININGDFIGSEIRVGRHLRELNIIGDVFGVDIEFFSVRAIIDIGRRASVIDIDGTVAITTIDVGHTVDSFTITDDLFDSIIEVGSNVSRRFVIGGSVDFSSPPPDPALYNRIYLAGSVNVFSVGGEFLGDFDGTTPEVEITGDCLTFLIGALGVGSVTDSEMTIYRDVKGMVDISDNVLDSTMQVGGNCRRFAVGLDVDGSLLNFGRRADTIHFEGDMINNSSLNVNGQLSTFEVFGGVGIDNSQVLVARDLFDLIILNDVVDSDITIFGRSRFAGIGGNLDGAGLYVGRSADDIRIGGNVDNDSSVEVQAYVDFLEIGGDLDNGSWIMIHRNAYDVQILGSIFGDGDPTTEDVHIGGRAYNFFVATDVVAADLAFWQRLRDLRIGNDVIDSTIMVRSRAKLIEIGNDLDESFIHIIGPCSIIRIGGDIHHASAATLPSPPFYDPFDYTIDVRMKLERLEVTGDIGAAGGVDVPIIRAGSLLQVNRRVAGVDTGGVIYGQIFVLGRLRDIYSAGTDAAPGVPDWQPYTGRFWFRDTVGALTDGFVDYVEWVGTIVS